MARVLLIDDDARLRELLTGYLAENDVSVRAAADGLRGLEALRSEPFDAVILDIMMPGIDGLEVLRRIRKDSRVPVLMLTAKGDEMDRVVGLEIGADDYISKPFGPRELLARLRAVLRRVSPEEPSPSVREGELALDLAARQAVDSGVVLDLTGLEFDLLSALVRRAGRVVTREALLRETKREDVSDRAVDVHISHLRQKLQDDPPRRIKTVRGVGYVFTKEAKDPK